MKKNQKWRRGSKDYMVRQLVEAMLVNKRLILELSEHMEVGSRCPLDWQLNTDHGHREIVQMIGDVSSWQWTCPFCSQEFKRIDYEFALKTSGETVAE